MLQTAIEHDGPISLRYPRGEGWGVAMDSEARALEIGKAEILRSGKSLAILAIGQTVLPALGAAEDLAPLGIDATVINARFVKPLDRELLCAVLRKASHVITVEDHAVAGGFGSAVLELLAEEDITGVRVRCLGVPDRFIPHGTQDELRKLCGFDREGITQAALQMMRLGRKRTKEGWERGSA
jgi:1-deoxy-D-xylulose-5-phosphate synthase